MLQFLNPVKLLGAAAVCSIVAIMITRKYYTGNEFDPFTLRWSLNVTSQVMMFYIVGLVCAGCGMIGAINGRFADKGEMTGWLTLPATTLEKYLSRLFIAFVAVPFYIFVVFGISEIVRVGYYSIFFPEHQTVFAPLLEFLRSYLFGEGFLFIVGIYSFFFFGAFLFRKKAVFKTILLGVVLTMIISYIALKTIFLRMAHYGNIRFTVENNIVVTSNDWMFVTISLVIIAFLLIWPYFKLKETELINRF